MRRFVCLLLTALLLVPAMTACGAGESAYEIAVRHGFEGSEADWLASLRGSDGKDGADATLDLSDAISRAYLSSVVISATHYRMEEVYGTSEKERRPFVSGGTGVFYSIDKKSGDAVIATNYHVIFSSQSDEPDGLAETVSVFLCGDVYLQEPIEATILGGSLEYDVALLKISGSEILKSSSAEAVVLSADPHVYPGQPVFLVGNANSAGISVVQGIISCEEETLHMPSVDGLYTMNRRLIRTDASVNPGNSGGGLFNERGEMIAMVEAKITGSTVDNIGYCLPMDVLLGCIYNIFKNCDGEENLRTLTTKMGVMMQVDSAAAVLDPDCGHVHVTETVTIQSVDEGKPATGLLLPGDRIMAVSVPGVLEKREIAYMHDVSEAILYVSPTDPIVLTVVRAGEEIEVTVSFENAEFSAS